MPVQSTISALVMTVSTAPIGARGLGLAHAVADHLAAAELHLLAVDREVALHLDEELGVGEADAVAGGRAVHVGIGGAGDAAGHGRPFRRAATEGGAQVFKPRLTQNGADASVFASAAAEKAARAGGRTDVLKDGVCAAALCAGGGWAVAETPLERGEYLVRGPMSCGNCHTPQGPEGPDMTKELAGGQLVIDVPEMQAYSANITPASEVGSGGRRARAGDPRGDPAGRHADRAADALQPLQVSQRHRPRGDRRLPAHGQADRERGTEVGLQHSRCRRPTGPRSSHVADIPRGPTAEYGKYMAGPISHCLECHTPMGPQGPMYDTALGQGGFEFPGPWGLSVAANITSSDDGLKGFSDEDLRR